jgi:hypothetical protein
MDPGKARRLNRALKIGLVGGLLLLHFWTRADSMRRWPVSGHRDYYTSYEYALSFVGGQGLTVLALDNLSAPGEAYAGGLTLRTIPSDLPIREFLTGWRDRLSREELDAYLRDIAPPGAPPRPGVAATFASSRVLELYLAGFVWKLVGIDWHHLFMVHCLFNTASCMGVFLIARRLGGSYWAGLCAAALYCASPLQTFVSTVSVRDASPLWFATVGFYLLICVADGFRRLPTNLASFVALGMATTVGLGWRHDAALLTPVLGAGLVLLLLHKGRRLRYVVVALVVFAGGAGLCLAGINALCGFRRMKSDVAYHCAFYGEYTRCNLLGLENSFQINWCDLQTYFEVCRRTYIAKGPGEPQPAPFGADCFARCKAMWLENLGYNAFAWVSQFPRFYWKVLGGLADAGTVQGVAPGALALLLPPWQQQGHLTYLKPLWAVLPWLFLVGAVVALTRGTEALASLHLLAFSALYAAILILVLPMQKHLALFLLPLHAFAGIGFWALVCLCRPSSWGQGFAVFLRGRSLRWTLVGTAILTVLWLGTCGIAYVYSSARRAGYLREIAALARQGVPAPETLRGKQLFTVRIPPTAEAGMPGYLLTLHTGDHPGPLVCRHVHHFRQTIAWGKGMRTLHQLYPNRTQYFFVSCCQGNAYGDLRPYSCTVAVEGDAEIVASTRVDLSHWDRLPLSTVFCEGERQPGSPRAPRPNTEYYMAPITVFGAPPPPGTKPETSETIPLRQVNHLLARDLTTGMLYVAVNDGTRFLLLAMGTWDARFPWTQPLVGDFDGDGLLDAVGQEGEAGSVWIARGNGGELVCEPWGQWPQGPDWVDLAVGDFDGDGRDDVFARNRRTGELAVAHSTGRSFERIPWGKWATEIDWKHVWVGDFDGDGKSDVAGFDPGTGQWWVARSTGDHFETRSWGTWPADVSWQHVCLGDFDGDGKSDLAGWDPRTGQWWVALSRGDHFECRPFGVTDPEDPWLDVAVGDVDGDGPDDLVGRSARTGQCWVARSAGDRFQPTVWGAMPGKPGSLCVADFNGDGRADVAWRDPSSGQLWVGLSGGNAFRFERWGLWPASGELTPLRAFRVWR